MKRCLFLIVGLFVITVSSSAQSICSTPNESAPYSLCRQDTAFLRYAPDVTVGPVRIKFGGS